MLPLTVRYDLFFFVLAGFCCRGGGGGGGGLGCGLFGGFVGLFELLVLLVLVAAELPPVDF
jgi:hypothetical protein